MSPKPGVLSPKTSTQFSINILRTLQKKDPVMGFTGQLTNIHHNMDSREQFEMLSTVSNYHPLGFPSTQDPQKNKNTKY